MIELLNENSSYLLRHFYLVSFIMGFRGLIFLVFEALRILNDFILPNYGLYLTELVLCNACEFLLVGLMTHSIYWMVNIKRQQIRTSINSI